MTTSIWVCLEVCFTHGVLTDRVSDLKRTYLLCWARPQSPFSECSMRLAITGTGDGEINRFSPELDSPDLLSNQTNMISLLQSNKVDVFMY